MTSLVQTRPADRTLRHDGPILECKDLCISYFTRAGELPAVIAFNMTLNQGESIGLVGESGCGKSTVAMAIIRYLGTNGAIVGGKVLYKGRDMATLSADRKRVAWGKSASVRVDPGGTPS